jgi:hypothetical protein
MDLIRGLIEALIWAALLFAAAVGAARPQQAAGADRHAAGARRRQGLGGSAVPIEGELTNGPAIGLDWFLLDLFLMALIYVPIERIWPYYPEQGRSGRSGRSTWSISSRPTCRSRSCRSWSCCRRPRRPKYLAIPALAHAIASLPFVVQFFLAVVVADVAEWTIHYALHKVPFLWRFHSIHHSSEALDWIAGSRSHFVDDTLVRGFILVPMMLAFSQTIILVYLVFVTLHATVDALQQPAQRQVARALPGDAALPPLASHLAEGVDRQELRDPLPVDRPLVRDLLLPRPLAREVRPRQRADPRRGSSARPSTRSSSATGPSRRPATRTPARAARRPAERGAERGRADQPERAHQPDRQEARSRIRPRRGRAARGSGNGGGCSAGRR